MDVTSWLVLSSYLLEFLRPSVVVGDGGELLVEYALVDEVADGEFQFEAFPQPLSEGDVDGIARHLVAVGHSDVLFAFGTALVTSHTDDALADAVVEYCGVDA